MPTPDSKDSKDLTVGQNPRTPFGEKITDEKNAKKWKKSKIFRPKKIKKQEKWRTQKTEFKGCLVRCCLVSFGRCWCCLVSSSVGWCCFPFSRLGSGAFSPLVCWVALLGFSPWGGVAVLSFSFSWCCFPSPPLGGAAFSPSSDACCCLPSPPAFPLSSVAWCCLVSCFFGWCCCFPSLVWWCCFPPLLSVVLLGPLFLRGVAFLSILWVVALFFSRLLGRAAWFFSMGWCCCSFILLFMVLPSFASSGWSCFFTIFFWVVLLSFTSCVPPLFCWLVLLGLMLLWVVLLSKVKKKRRKVKGKLKTLAKWKKEKWQKWEKWKNEKNEKNLLWTVEK